MAKKQTRRSISVSRTTYERLKAFCETNHISMSQLVETRVNDFLGADVALVAPAPSSMRSPPPITPRPPAFGASPARSVESRGPQVAAAAGSAMTSTMGAAQSAPSPGASHASPHVPPHPAPHQAPHPVPMTSAAARFAVEPPPPIIKPRQETAAPKPAEKRPEQIFTF